MNGPTRSRTAASLTTAAGVAALALVVSACGGSSSAPSSTAGSSDGASGGTGGGKASLSMLIASSGDAETNAVKAATAAWATATGNTVDVQVAQDMQQQLGQAFAGGTPPDVFYVDAGRFPDYAKSGALYAYGDQAKAAKDFYPALVQTFTYDGKFYCAPKDFSTLALEINTDAWTAAGLTDADIPTDWAGLKAVAEKLTKGDQAGLVIGDTRDRIGAFMVQAGGWILNEDGTKVTADSPENVEALTYVKSLLSAGVAKYPKQVSAGWGGEAFGLGKAAMTMEGNWIKGAMKNDFPERKYTVVELPAGPAGKGTLTFTQCWGIADKSGNKEAAVSLVDSLTTVDQQMAFADAFGVMPSLQSAKDPYVAKYPEDKAFIAGGEYAQGPVNQPGMDPVLAEFDTGLQGLASSDPKQILSSLKTNAEAALTN